MSFEGDIPSVMGLDFTILDEFWGTVREVALCENGADIPVTQANKSQFVALYINYLLRVSVQDQLSSLVRGFVKVRVVLFHSP